MHGADTLDTETRQGAAERSAKGSELVDVSMRVDMRDGNPKSLDAPNLGSDLALDLIDR